MCTLRSRKALLEEGAFTSIPRGSGPARRSLPFFPDLHTEVSRSWNSPFSARLFVPASYNYGSIAGLDERGYRAMPRVEQTLASYLSPGSASSLKAPALPTKPLRVTSALVGKGYTAASQAGACLHTMSVLQAYQADLLKELDEGEEIKDADIEEIRRTADLALRATKEAARAIGQSMAALVAAERHLWLTLSDMKEKDRVFLLDTPLSPSGLFGDSVNSVVDRYQEAPHEAAGQEQPWPSTSSSYRDAQKQSMATRTPPHRERVVVRSKSGTSKARSDLRETSKHIPRFLSPGNVAGPGSSPPPRGSQGPPVQGLPAGEPLQDIVLAAQQTQETSLERLVPLVDHLAAWKLLPNVSAWVLHTVERGYRIQFGAPLPPFIGVSPALVGPEQGLVMEQEVASLLRKEAIEVVSPHDRESGFYSRYFIAPIESILAAVRRVKEGRSLTVKQFQQLLGLTAAASNVIPFGLLYMRPLQWWLKTRGFSPRGNPFRMVKVKWRCLRALDMWRNPWFLSQDPVLRAPCRRVTLATDASLTGWGAVMSGHTARGLWRGHQLTWHINCLEMLAVFQVLKHFLPDLRDRHVLVRTDNTAVVSYINHQGGLRSRPLYKLPHQILVCSPM
ncbi:ORF V: Enzymatic polyprotein [Labeo rohita]|uniref:ORF V: Enzymatic polyprotein n=1 Tax=Labeo rohita TaxID=84645 RepID=A0ABQ8LBM8_LABRO|nr:ORF V: Enzymatic polyprotein [Labeo rohita]